MPAPRVVDDQAFVHACGAWVISVVPPTRWIRVPGGLPVW